MTTRSEKGVVTKDMARAMSASIPAVMRRFLAGENAVAKPVQHA